MANSWDVCDQAHICLDDKRSFPQSTLLPPDSFYFSLTSIRQVLECPGEGLTLKDLFLCQCFSCRSHAGVKGEDDHRAHSLSEATRQELLGPYAIIYALLIYVRKPGLIHRFREEGIILEGTHFLNEGNLGFLSEAGLLRDAREARVVRTAILDHQYKFLIRKLDARDEVTKISAKEILPICEDLEPKGHGSFAEVHGFKVQDDDYRGNEFKNRQITRFARKTFKPEYMEVGKLAEWFILKKLRKIEHDHLMTALGAYSYGGTFFILMEEADETLGDYLKGRGASLAFTPKELWLQVQGIAAGLASLHSGASGSSIAYHMDLKPANILIVRRVLKISDFGLLQFKNAGPHGDSGVQERYGFRSYAAPDTGTMYTRSSDVWSLGAIISEIATFDIQQKEGVEKYRKDRQSEPEPQHTIGSLNFHADGKVKKSVLERHLILERDVEKSKGLRTHKPLDRFQEHFFGSEFFPFMETLLHHYRPLDAGAPIIRTSSPGASEVADRIGKFYRQAELDILAEDKLPNQIGLPDIWEAVDSGLLPDIETASSRRLKAWIQAKDGEYLKCGLLLFTDPKHLSVTIKCHTNEVWNEHLQLVIRDFTYQREKAITPATVTPSYITFGTANFEGILLQLRQINNTVSNCWLQSIEDALTLQAAVCGHYPYKLRTFPLSAWSLSKSNLFLKAKEEIYLEPLHVQLWSYGPLDTDSDSPIWADNSWVGHITIIHLAILSRSAIFLIEVAWDRPALAEPPDPSCTMTIRSSKGKIFRLQPEGSIPLSLRRPDEDSGSKYKHAKLTFKSQDDRNLFDKYLSELRGIWEDKERDRLEKQRGHH